ncbi:IclR family transcriptional regulator [Mesorhizobium muleiense]|uniref:IclR family transcriptional regulator n=1 Tax=Mesorhizobium muleiense TaxID=1004279 RepID=UPI001F1DF30B|nr:IclR family transcriptional regulator [Mesorhizobium muleiense]MCF6116828.1 IclR family transcriptional regulator [Mesorhizobium muleiense]
MAEISLTGDQMLTVLETVAKKGPVGAADVARTCDINRTVAYRLLVTLEQRAYVRRGHDGYTLGSAIIDLVRHLDRDISSIARPLMATLANAAGETVVLHCLNKDEAVVTEQALGNKHLVRVQHVPGSRHPLHLGASGWAMLAFQDQKTIARIVKKAADPAATMARVEQIQRAGYAISHDELQMGVHGVAAPLLEQSGRCNASLAILVPSVRAEALLALTPKLLETAAHISKQL